jgi:hypothetical protein
MMPLVRIKWSTFIVPIRLLLIVKLSLVAAIRWLAIVTHQFLQTLSLIQLWLITVSIIIV